MAPPSNPSFKAFSGKGVSLGSSGAALSSNPVSTTASLRNQGQRQDNGEQRNRNVSKESVLIKQRLQQQQESKSTKSGQSLSTGASTTSAAESDEGHAQEVTKNDKVR